MYFLFIVFLNKIFSHNFMHDDLYDILNKKILYYYMKNCKFFENFNENNHYQVIKFMCNYNECIGRLKSLNEKTSISKKDKKSHNNNVNALIQILKKNRKLFEKILTIKLDA